MLDTNTPEYIVADEVLSTTKQFTAEDIFTNIKSELGSFFPFKEEAIEFIKKRLMIMVQFNLLNTDINLSKYVRSDIGW